MTDDNVDKYCYNAMVASVYDGDTIRCDVDLGFGTWLHNQSFRLHGIDAPEVRGKERAEGIATRDWLSERLPIGEDIVIETIKDKKGKYGRYLAVVYHNGINLNEEMVELGLAKIYGKKK